MRVGSDVLHFVYDASGRPMAVTYNGTNYYYVTNLQGDVVAILNEEGTAVVTYTYDAWGKILTTGGEMADTLGAVNPLRYRGYVYDQETQLYYLQSRYYDPNIGRFINADAFASTGQGFTGNNIFAYCGCNPVVRVDSNGRLWDYALDIVFIIWGIADVAADPTDWKDWVALAVDVAFAVIPFVPSGQGQIIKAGSNMDDVYDIVNAVNQAADLQDLQKVTVIGRWMNRVEPVAQMLGYSDEVYQALQGLDMSNVLHQMISAADNGCWMISKLRQGYTVIDIGLSAAVKGSSLMYGAEQVAIRIWQTRNVWKAVVNTIS
jgi:RHS repeat-associated protein